MAWIDALIALEIDSREARPSVRLWIDTDPQADEWNECEVALRQRAPGQWTGSFSIPSAASLQLLFRLGLITRGDGDWSLTLLDRTRGRVLHRDGDTLALAKTWVVGTCALDPALSPPVRPAFGAHLLRRPVPANDAVTPEPSDRNVVRLDRYR